MDDEKTGNALVLLPRLELVPFDSLPTKFTQELAVANQERKWALDKLRGSLVPACIASVTATVFIFLTFYTFFTAVPVLAFFLSAIMGAGGSLVSFYFVREHKRDVDAYRQRAIPLQLEVGAENEFVVSEMATIANNMAVTWNRRVECAPPEEMDKRFVKALKIEREGILQKLEKVKKVIKAIEKDSFDTEKE